ncbi:MAG: NosD domain-containing protein [Candidatus Thermoplasmatota archaeon]
MDRRFYIAIIIVLLAFGALEFNSGGLREHPEHQVEIGVDENDDWEQIELRNNSELQEFAEKSNLSGNGTEDDPYIISGENMTGRGESPGLYLSNIDLHLRVENNLIHNCSDAGVVLFRVSNLTMIDNEIREVRTGLYIEDSSGNLFLSNVFSAPQTIGLNIRGESADNLFYENSFEGCGIQINLDEKNVGAQEIHSSNTIDGEPIYYVSDEAGEVIKEKNIGQLIIGNSANIEVQGALIDSGSVGLTIIHSENVSVRNATIKHQRLDGVQIRESENVVIESCWILENEQHGIKIPSSKNITITDNLIERSKGFGITLGADSTDNDVFLNAFRRNRRSAYMSSDSFPPQARENDEASSNRWNSSQGLGNYWEPWNVSDEEGDGIISEPYRIEGSDSLDNHPLSSTIGPPEDILVEPRDGAAKLNWSEPRYSIYEPLQYIRIYRGRVEDNISFYDQIDATTEGMMDENLTNNESYHYRFRSSSDLNESVFSPSFRVVPEGTEPTVVEYSPAGGDVPVNSTITVRFSEKMLKGSVDISIDGISGEVSGEGSTYHFEPEENLSYGETYNVNVTGKDLASNTLKERWIHWSFTTTSAAVIRGRVISEEGEPIEGAVVISDEGAQNTTDSNGRFEIRVKPGSRTFKVNKEGYFEKVFDIEVESGQEKEKGVIEMEEEESGGEFSRWFWPLILFALVIIFLGIAASVTFLRDFKKREPSPEEEEEELYEEEYEDISQEEFDSWWEDD